MHYHKLGILLAVATLLFAQAACNAPVTGIAGTGPTPANLPTSEPSETAIPTNTPTDEPTRSPIPTSEPLQARALCEQPLFLSTVYLQETSCDICLWNWKVDGPAVSLTFPDADSKGRHPSGLTATSFTYSQPSAQLAGRPCPGELPDSYTWPITVAANEPMQSGNYQVPLVIDQPGVGSVEMVLDVAVSTPAGTPVTFAAAIQTFDGHYLTAVDGGGHAQAGAIVTSAGTIGPEETFNFLEEGENLYAMFSTIRTISPWPIGFRNTLPASCPTAPWPARRQSGSMGSKRSSFSGTASTMGIITSPLSGATSTFTCWK